MSRKIISTIEGKACQPHKLVHGASGNRWGCRVCRKFSGIRPEEHGVMPVSCEPDDDALAKFRADAQEIIRRANEDLIWANYLEGMR